MCLLSWYNLLHYCSAVGGGKSSLLLSEWWPFFMHGSLVGEIVPGLLNLLLPLCNPCPMSKLWQGWLGFKVFSCWGRHSTLQVGWIEKKATAFHLLLPGIELLQYGNWESGSKTGNIGSLSILEGHHSLRLGPERRGNSLFLATHARSRTPHFLSWGRGKEEGIADYSTNTWYFPSPYWDLEDFLEQIFRFLLYTLRAIDRYFNFLI